jgi:hypothetical protein
VDWLAWHEDYADADSPLSRRLALVQGYVRGALDRAPSGALRAISVCAGQGHGLLGALAGHRRAADVTARLVELDERNVRVARDAARAAGLGGVEAVVADASLTDSYKGATPADLLLLCGVLGNVTAGDIATTIRNLPRLCAPNATVVWTRHRDPPDLVPYILEAFDAAAFRALAYSDSPPFGIGVNQLTAPPQAFERGIRLFEFVGYDTLRS